MQEPPGYYREEDSSITTTEAYVKENTQGNEQTKTCNLCKETKPVSEFYKDSYKGNPASRCKVCFLRLGKEYRDTNKEKINARRRELLKVNKKQVNARRKDRYQDYVVGVKDYHYRMKYGLSWEAYCNMLTSQSSGCAICGVVFTGETRLFPVDHIHDETRRVRAILCDKCNSILGYAFDNPNILRRAADYLDRHAQEPEEVSNVRLLRH